MSQLLYRLNFMSVTYACSPVEPEVQLLSQISITSTISVFFGGIEYQPNDNLNDLFVIQYFGAYTVQELVDFQHNNPYILANQSDDIIFQFVSKPDITVNQKFTFTLTFDDGLEYQTVTPLFTVD